MTYQFIDPVTRNRKQRTPIWYIQLTSPNRSGLGFRSAQLGHTRPYFPYFLVWLVWRLQLSTKLKSFSPEQVFIEITSRRQIYVHAREFVAICRVFLYFFFRKFEKKL